MILAAGLTPAWQQILRFDRFRQGEVNRAQDACWCASGKVLNVAVALHHLGAACEAIALVGGPPREAIAREFSALGIPAHWVEARHPTRVCSTILDLASGAATELVENAAPVTAAELESFRAVFASRAAAADVTILSGSLPDGAPASFFRELLESAPRRAILDIRGEALFAALSQGPFLVKPNREELAQSLARPLDDEGPMVAALRELNDRGAEWAVVTDGAKPVWACDRHQVFRFTCPKMDVVNPIGSGDCLAAGIAWGLTAGLDPVQAIQIGIAAAAENVSQLLPGRINPEKVRQRAATVLVEER